MTKAPPRSAGAELSVDGVLVVDKPLGLSSHAVVALARRALGTRHIGHAGTLDPMATGVLVLAVGEGLKIVRYLALDDKRYAAVVRLGSETDTLDADGSVTERAEIPALGLAQVAAAARAFEGVSLQRAPVISALKRAGVPLYASARRGEVVVAPTREVVVHALVVHEVAGDQITLDVHCGKGFYVRSLARDLGRALGTVGHLARLRRVQSGRFRIEDAVDAEMLQAASRGEASARALLMQAAIPIERALEAAPRIRLDAAGAEHARQGRPIVFEHALDHDADSAEPEPVLLCDEHGTLLAIGRREQSCLRIVRGLRRVVPARG